MTGYALHVAQYATDPLDELMNGQVKDYLGIPRAVRWGSQSGNVFNAQAGDFMKDNIDTGSIAHKNSLRQIFKRIFMPRLHEVL